MRGGLVRRYAHVDGLRWHYRVGGPLDAPPVVMPHGFVISGTYLLPLARLFARTHRLYLPDVPGFGRSAKPPEAWDLPAMARGLARWMDAEGVPRASFVGNSMGCQMIVELAAQAPDRVDRAALIGPTMDPEAGAWGNALRLLRDAPREHPLLVLEHVPDYLRAGVPRALRTYRHALAHPMLSRAALVRCPVLVLRGTRDPIVTPRWARRLARAFPDARLVEVDGAHALNYSHPRRVEAVLRPFLPAGASAPEWLPGRSPEPARLGALEFHDYHPQLP